VGGGFDPGLLLQLARGRGVEGLVDVDEPTRQRPSTLVRGRAAPDEEDVEHPLHQGQHHDVDGHGERGVVARSVVGLPVVGACGFEGHGARSPDFW